MSGLVNVAVKTAPKNNCPLLVGFFGAVFTGQLYAV